MARIETEEDIAAYDGDQYRQGWRMLENLRAELNRLNLSETHKIVFRRVLKQAVEAALISSEAIHHPITESKAKKLPFLPNGSRGDYLTDAEELLGMPRVFRTPEISQEKGAN